MPHRLQISLAVALAVMVGSVAAPRADAAETIPHAQDRAPGPPLSPAEALAKMQVPEGFTVELVASEPEIVNPVAMTFDERGRIWITESLEYPRHEAGPGRDRIKVLEDTDGDGRADKFTVFAEGLNIPSGIAVGHGGVWVANAPDILFMQDTDGDGRADKQEVVVTGFGRLDTHELPNSLTWGPDGWLYGLNGVFNPARVKQGEREFNFTCALFRIHPRTRAFELFAEGTSNPWGVAWNNEGAAFLSACVIDHLWHLTETGYYVRQGGPYPPFTSIIGSIVSHRHQKAAYCGIHFFDSDAYPLEYRERLYMGNIHAGAINVDDLERDGSSYRGLERPDFLTANDAWFMPVVQKTGPDGCLYILDWYDRYHCYQDAGRDPAGIDRLKGRLYRVRYKNTPRTPRFDLARESDERLVERLLSPNVFFRDIAQRLLVERNHAETRAPLQAMVLDESTVHKSRMHALWALVGSGALDSDFHKALLVHRDPSLRAWGVRAAGNFARVAPDSVTPLVPTIVKMARDDAADVRLEVAIAARKLAGVDAMAILCEVLAHSGDDKLIPHIVWQNLHPLVEDHSDQLLAIFANSGAIRSPAMLAVLPRLLERILARREFDPAPVVALLTAVIEKPTADDETAQRCLALIMQKIHTGELAGDRRDRLKAGLAPLLARALRGPNDAAVYFDSALLALALEEAAGAEVVRKVFADPQQSTQHRRQALDALVLGHDARAKDAVAAMFADPRSAPVQFRAAALDTLGRSGEAWVSGVIVANYAKLEPELQPKAIELLTERGPWAHDLLDAIGRKQISASALNLNQVRKLMAMRDAALAEKVSGQWGTLRAERNRQREQVINRLRGTLRSATGDANAGMLVFARVCGQCHKIYGQGQEVGPDLTSNGRSSFEQLLSNVFDPSLVIGADYQARTVITADGRIFRGLLVEDNAQRVVLKTEGGKLETLPRANVEEVSVSKLSLMPEELENQLKPEELIDLFAFLTLDKPPTDPTARQLPGARQIAPQATTDAAKFEALLGQFAPPFTTDAVGEGGLAIVAEHFGRFGVLRTHPVNRDTPCVLKATIDVPAGKHTRLVLSVGSYGPQGDWQLIVKANGRTMHDEIINAKTTEGPWHDVSVDLSEFAGKPVNLELHNRANNWSWEFGYWSRIEVVSAE